MELLFVSKISKNMYQKWIQQKLCFWIKNYHCISRWIKNQMLNTKCQPTFFDIVTIQKEQRLTSSLLNFETTKYLSWDLVFRIGGSIETNNSQFYLVAFIKKIKVGLYAECLDFDCMNYLVKYYIVYGLAFHIHKIKIPTYVHYIYPIFPCSVLTLYK